MGAAALRPEPTNCGQVGVILNTVEAAERFSWSVEEASSATPRELLLLATAIRACRQSNVRIMPISSGSLSRMRESPSS
jgi:hypothetical protein